jgi:hypothetical protein
LKHDHSASTVGGLLQSELFSLAGASLNGFLLSVETWGDCVLQEVHINVSGKTKAHTRNNSLPQCRISRISAFDWWPSARFATVIVNQGTNQASITSELVPPLPP